MDLIYSWTINRPWAMQTGDSLMFLFTVWNSKCFYAVNYIINHILYDWFCTFPIDFTSRILFKVSLIKIWWMKMLFKFFTKWISSRRGRDRMVVRFTTTYANSAYHSFFPLPIPTFLNSVIIFLQCKHFWNKMKIMNIYVFSLWFHGLLYCSWISYL